MTGIIHVTLSINKREDLICSCSQVETDIENMKTFLLIALLALLANTIFAQYVEVNGQDAKVDDEKCKHEQMDLKSCGNYMMGWCKTKRLSITQPWKWGMKGCHEIHNQCCQQLRKTTLRCRCMAIKKMIQGDLFLRFQPGKMSKVMERGKILPAMCGMAPIYCNIPMVGGYY
uniref:Uncharacterized protein n=1 Tax=Avena sativa TaxID=4498 RepID=A0ACD6A1R4_AVESA